MRSAICLLSLFFVPALGGLASPWDHVLPSLSTHPPSGLNRPSNHPPPAPIHPPSTLQPPMHQPSTHQPPTQPPTNPSRLGAIRPRPPPPHGHVVAFQMNNGPHPGVILGSHPDRQGKFMVAPAKLFRDNKTQRSELRYPNMVMKVHPNDMLSSGIMLPSAASNMMDHHAQHPPMQVDITAPILGSRNYLHGSRIPGDHR